MALERDDRSCKDRLLFVDLDRLTENEDRMLEFLGRHHVIDLDKNCPLCNKPNMRIFKQGNKLANMTLKKIADQCQMAEPTAVRLSKFCRQVVYWGMIAKGEAIGGNGDVVEIDESKFSENKHHRGHPVQGSWAFGGISRNTGNVFMVQVERRDRATLLPLIQRWIMPGTLIIADGWKAYDNLTEHDFDLLRVNHSKTFKTDSEEVPDRYPEHIRKAVHTKGRYLPGDLARYLFIKQCMLASSDPFLAMLNLCRLSFDSGDDLSYDFCEEDDGINPTFNENGVPYNKEHNLNDTETKTNLSNETSKKILMWTTIFGRAHGPFGNCPGLDQKCQILFNRNEVGEADAIVFHIPDLKLKELPPPPPQANGSTAYVFMVQESPPSSYAYHGLASVPKNFFHWTMTVLSDSEMPFPYGGYWVAPQEAARLGFTPENFTYDVKSALSLKTKAIYWMVSNCETHSKREVAVKALQNFIPVDIFGKCGPTEEMRTICPKSAGAECENQFAMSHHFYIAAENSICKDYISEKYWSRIHLPVIPIVMKKEIYQNLIPPRSYIAMDDFDSPKALADHLKHLIENPKEYLKYFEWRTKGWARAPWNHKNYRTSMCKLCELLVDNKHTNLKPMENVEKWFVTKSNCENSFASKWAQRNISR